MLFYKPGSLYDAAWIILVTNARISTTSAPNTLRDPTSASRFMNASSWFTAGVLWPRFDVERIGLGRFGRPDEGSVAQSTPQPATALGRDDPSQPRLKRRRIPELS